MVEDLIGVIEDLIGVVEDLIEEVVEVAVAVMGPLVLRRSCR